MTLFKVKCSRCGQVFYLEPYNKEEENIRCFKCFFHIKKRQAIKVEILKERRYVYPKTL